MNFLRRFHCPAAWPTTLMVVIFLSCYAFVAGIIWLLQFGPPTGTAPPLSDTPELENFLAAIPIVAAIVFALFRLLRFHPACKPPYSAWLSLTPWTTNRPFPLGPIHPVWQDAAVIAIPTALVQWHSHGDASGPLVACVLTFLIAMTAMLIFTRSWRAVVALGFLWPALLLPGLTIGQETILLAGIITFVWLGHRDSLRSFPWPFLYNIGQFNPSAPGTTLLSARIPGLARVPQYVGWPNLALSPKFKRPSITLSHAARIGLLAGWWSYCIIKKSNVDAAPDLLFIFALLCAALRVAIYSVGATPAINLWGRLSSGRFILPGYDKIFLTPLAVIFMGIAGDRIIHSSGSWYPLAEACTFGLLWFAVFSGGPSLQSWQLTAPLRLTFASTDKSQRLRRI